MRSDVNIYDERCVAMTAESKCDRNNFIFYISVLGCITWAVSNIN